VVSKLSLEGRKVQQTPDGTYLVSLPKNWAKRFNLKKGSLIYVRERMDGCLVMDPQYAVDIAPEISLKSLNRLEDQILTNYLSGYEIITIEAPDIMRARDRVKKSINRLIGVEIIEEEPHKVVLQCLLKATVFPPSKILRREYVLSASMYKDAITSLLTHDIFLAKSINGRDDEVDRLYFLLVRLLRSLIMNPRLSEKLEISLIECLDYRLIASLIENIADQAVEIANCAINMPKVKMNSKILDLIKEAGSTIQDTYENAVRAIFSKDEKIQALALSKRDEAEARIKVLQRKLKSENEFPPITYTLLSILQRILDCLTDIIDLVTPHLHAV
jgi:phosphate uptake regulator